MNINYKSNAQNIYVSENLENGNNEQSKNCLEVSCSKGDIFPDFRDKAIPNTNFFISNDKIIKSDIIENGIHYDEKSGESNLEINKLYCIDEEKFIYGEIQNEDYNSESLPLLNKPGNKMTIQKFGNPVYINYRSNTYSHNHISLNSSGESLSSSQYSYKNGTGSTSSNSSSNGSNDDSPISNGSHSLNSPYQNILPHISKSAAHLLDPDMDNTCDENTAQNKELISNFTLHNNEELEDTNIVDNNTDHGGLYFDEDYVKTTSCNFENFNNNYQKNNGLYTVLNINSPTNIPLSLSAISTAFEQSSKMITSTIYNISKEDRSSAMPLLYSKPGIKVNQYTNPNIKDMSFLKSRIISLPSSNSLCQDENPKSPSHIIMIDEEDDSSCSLYNKSMNSNLVNKCDDINVLPLSTFQKTRDIVQKNVSNYGTTSHTKLNEASTCDDLWARETVGEYCPRSSVIQTSQSNNFTKNSYLELGLGCLSAGDDVNNYSNATTNQQYAQTSNPYPNTALRPTPIDQPIQFLQYHFNTYPSTSIYSNSSPPLSFHNSCSFPNRSDGRLLPQELSSNMNDTDIEMKDMRSNGDNNYQGSPNSNMATNETNTKGGDNDGTKKRVKHKKKKQIINDISDNENNSIYLTENNPALIACTYPELGNNSGMNTTNSKKMKSEKKREKRINKNVKASYVAKDDQGNKDINYLVDFIEGNLTARPTPGSAFKNYKDAFKLSINSHPCVIKASSGIVNHGRYQPVPSSSSKESSRTYAPLSGSSHAHMGADGTVSKGEAGSTFSLNTLVDEKCNSSCSYENDSCSRDTISETQSHVSQHISPQPNYESLKKHYSSEDLGPHAIDTDLLFPGQSKDSNLGTRLENGSTRSDEDYSTPPQDFQEKFHVVHKKQYRKEPPTPPANLLSRTVGKGSWASSHKNKPRYTGPSCPSNHQPHNVVGTEKSYDPCNNPSGDYKKCDNSKSATPNGSACESAPPKSSGSSQSTVKSVHTHPDPKLIDEPVNLPHSSNDPSETKPPGPYQHNRPPHHFNSGRDRPRFPLAPAFGVPKSFRGAAGQPFVTRQTRPAPSKEDKEDCPATTPTYTNTEQDFPPLVCSKPPPLSNPTEGTATCSNDTSAPGEDAGRAVAPFIPSPPLLEKASPIDVGPMPKPWTSVLDDLTKHSKTLITTKTEFVEDNDQMATDTPLNANSSIDGTEEIKNSYAAMVSKIKKSIPPRTPMVVKINNGNAISSPPPAPTTSEPSQTLGSDETPSLTSKVLVRSHDDHVTMLATDPSIIEISPRHHDREGDPDPARRIDDPAPASPRVIFLDSCRESTFLNREPRVDEGLDGGAAFPGIGESISGIIFGLDLDSQEIFDIINDTDTKGVSGGPGARLVEEGPQPTKCGQVWGRRYDLSADFFEALGAERRKMQYLAPYFAKIWEEVRGKIVPASTI